jgi:Flp pilus assembly protein TadG
MIKGKIISLNSSGAQENGQSLVEFAITLVILLILLAGLVDTGRALFTYLALRESAEEGALFGSTDPSNTSAIEARARNSSDMVRGFDADVTVQVNVIGAACTGNAIKVTVTYANFPITMPFLGTILGSQTIPISATATNTILRPGCS